MVEALRLKENSDFSSESLSNGYQTKFISTAIPNGTEKDSLNTMQKDATAPTQAVKVAVHVRPLIASEKLQGCKDCVTIVPGEPQVQIGNSGFTFDHVYGSTATSSSMIFEECIGPLVEGMFLGYNATVLAYGQTGSGKTYTMGTAYTVGDEMNGVIPQVMDLIFKKMETSAGKVDFQVRVSFIEILNEEVHDLLDSTSSINSRPDVYNGFCTRPVTPKSMIQIRETMNGEITLSGVTECEVNSLQEMSALLEQGSLSRATASTNMNSQSSRSHAILTITLRQQRRFELHADHSPFLHNYHDCLCAKIHLVDLAGSERVKRTGADGVRFKEGVHINKGLLALGNVISALGDEKKRKEGGHVPYRDSKLTRLLQDSLGGNSRTVMIACISPADSNAEETLNTLKYANRARNIQNKPMVNRDPMAAEVQHLREQLELLQAELLCVHGSSGSLEDTNMLKQKITWLEANNRELRQELQRAHDGLQFCAQRVLSALIERDNLRHKLELLQNGMSWEDVKNGIDGDQMCYLDDSLDLLYTYTNKVQNVESSFDVLEDTKLEVMSESFTNYTSGSGVCTGDYMEVQVDGGMCTPPEEEGKVADREAEHARLQVSLDNELNELNERLKRKEAEMKTIFTPDNMILKQQFEKKLLELEEEKKTLQIERDELLLEIKNLACVSDVKNQRTQDACNEKLKDLESQLTELKHKQDNQTQLLKQRLRGDDAAKCLQEEIQRMKTQKVQLQQKIKQEAEQFRCWKASREKELLQLRKEGRKTEHEMLKLQTLNQRQKMVLQRKTEEAALATRRLKDLLEARKKENTNAGSNIGNNGYIKQGHPNHKALLQSIDQDLELAVHIHEVRKNYEKQSELRARIARELGKLNKQDSAQNTLEASRHEFEQTSTAFLSVSSPAFISSRAELLRNMLETSSNTLISMASQLSEAEERERASTGRGRWQQLRTTAEAKGLLHYLFNVAIDARCQLWDKNMENRDLKENIERLTKALKLNERHRIELYQQKRQASLEIHGFKEISLGFSHIEGVSPPSGRTKCLDSCAERQYRFRKVALRRSKKAQNTSMGKLVRWRRSHERWFLQFRWRWQKPWQLSERIRHGDEFLTRKKTKSTS